MENIIISKIAYIENIVRFLYLTNLTHEIIINSNKIDKYQKELIELVLEKNLLTALSDIDNLKSIYCQTINMAEKEKHYKDYVYDSIRTIYFILTDDDKSDEEKLLQVKAKISGTVKDLIENEEIENIEDEPKKPKQQQSKLDLQWEGKNKDE